jgi:hypothetical protein
MSPQPTRLPQKSKISVFSLLTLLMSITILSNLVKTIGQFDRPVYATTVESLPPTVATKILGR